MKNPLSDLPPLTGPLRAEALLAWLRTGDPEALEHLWARADELRRQGVGDEVHLRGLVEVSNRCARQCAYCGLRADNRSVSRYAMSDEEVLECAHRIRDYGWGTAVLQSGEDPAFTSERVEALVRRIKAETGLAITLSLGERSEEELRAWKRAGADRYLLRFETSDRALFQRIHPPLPGRECDRLGLLKLLRDIGYEVGSGVMVGIPGQGFESLARDLELFAELELDMIGLGPFIPHPDTPLGTSTPPPSPDQVPATVDMAFRVLALARVQRPEANLPATTALATLDRAQGRILGLQRGANVVMPNVTPLHHRLRYSIYPNKASSNETAEQTRLQIDAQLASIGRSVAAGPGHSPAFRRRIREQEGAPS